MTDAFAAAVDAVRSGAADAEQAAAGLRRELTDDELLWLLDGDAPMLRGLRAMGRRYNQRPYVAGRIERLGVPGIRFTDGPRGVVVGSSTAFPVAIARAASWDPELERRIGAAVGAEARAQGANLFAGVCVNVPPFPGWGRTQECYGEEPVLTGAMGAALSTGAQPWVMTCVKHYALNSMEEARFVVDVEAAEDVLREAYLPHFRTVVEAGVDCVMSSYNSVNGEWAGDNRHLLTEILRDDWGFRGFVMTDFVWGLRRPVESVGAGQELEMPLRQQRARTLPAALRDGRLRREDVELAADRLLATQLRYAARAEPDPAPGVVASGAHLALAREAAARGAVLLRNASVDGSAVLPLAAESLAGVAVFGRLADGDNLGDHGSSRVHPPAVVTVLDGLRERLGPRVRHVTADDVGAARAADVAVVVVGLGPHDEGEALAAMDPEAVQVFGGVTRWRPVAVALSKVIAAASRRAGIVGGDRRDLRLPAADVALVEAVIAANPRTVVVVVGGGTIVLDPWDAAAGAVLLAWYPGMEGGRAIADVLLGDAEPGGRLPVAIPRRATDLPAVDWRARRVAYPRWWGQLALDRAGVDAAYPLGFGLGYATFAAADLTVGPVVGERFPVGVTVTNTGARAGRHVVQVYAHLPGGEQGGRPVRTLLGFASVEVGAGRTVPVLVECTTRPLQRWTGTGFAPAGGTVTVEAGAHSGDPAALVGTVALP